VHRGKRVGESVQPNAGVLLMRSVVEWNEQWNAAHAIENEHCVEAARV
jgi:hypothetical protein